MTAPATDDRFLALSAALYLFTTLSPVLAQEDAAESRSATFQAVEGKQREQVPLRAADPAHLRQAAGAASRHLVAQGRAHRGTRGARPRS